MKKEPLFPFWSDLERVIAVAQSQEAYNLRLTLVSLEIYPHNGFLVTMNVEATAPNESFSRIGLGWMRSVITDQAGNRYTSMLAMLPGKTYNHIFRGRIVLICRNVNCSPQGARYMGELSIIVNAIEWEYTDGDESQPSSEVIAGPWEFTVAL